MGSHYYISISIVGNQFSMDEYWLTKGQKKYFCPKGESLATITLLAIEGILKEDLKEIGQNRDPYTLQKRLKERAKTIRDGYLQKTAQLPFFKRLFGGISQKEKEIQKLYERIEKWEMTPKIHNISIDPNSFIPPSADGKTRVLDLYDDPILYLQNFLSAEEIRALAQVNKHGTAQAQQGEIKLAQEYGYQGHDLAKAKDYLNNLFHAVDILVKDGYIPEDCVVRRGKWPFWRYVDPETTLRNTKYLSGNQRATLKIKLNEALLHYSSSGNAAVCMTLLYLDADIECLDQDGRTPLARAALKGKRDVCEALIQKGANVNPINIHGNTPLIHANKYPDIVRLLLENGATAVIDHSGPGGNTALHFAARNGNKKTVELLIKYGADIECLDQDGRTPLARAAIEGKRDICEALIQKGANVNPINIHGNTPLIHAISKYPDIGRLLLENGAAAVIDHIGNHGNSALHFAASEGNKKTVELLIEYGADIECLDQDGRTPLARAALEGKRDVCEILIQKGANVNPINIHGNTPLIHAKKYPDIVRLLLENGAAAIINHMGHGGNTALHFAASRGNGEAVQLLIVYGADCTLLNNQGKTAAQLTDIHFIKNLLK
jgi:ankyrin repeat protein